MGAKNTFHDKERVLRRDTDDHKPLFKPALRDSLRSPATRQNPDWKGALAPLRQSNIGANAPFQSTNSFCQPLFKLTLRGLGAKGNGTLCSIPFRFAFRFAR